VLPALFVSRHMQSGASEELLHVDNSDRLVRGGVGGPVCSQHHAHNIDRRWMVCPASFLSFVSQAHKPKSTATRSPDSSLEGSPCLPHAFVVAEAATRPQQATVGRLALRLDQQNMRVVESDLMSV
jgi:hypothetical protein